MGWFCRAIGFTLALVIPAGIRRTPEYLCPQLLRGIGTVTTVGILAMAFMALVNKDLILEENLWEVLYQ